MYSTRVLRHSAGWAVGVAMAFFTACGTPRNGEGPLTTENPDASPDSSPIGIDGGPPDGSSSGPKPDADGNGDAAVNPPPPPQNLATYVDPFIGTGLALTTGGAIGGGQGGSVFPGADVPFGMVQFSPDTPNGQPSGYLYTDTQIDSFSLTHFSGAGCPNGGDVQILPVVSSAQTAVTYAKADEHAAAGYYTVKTSDGVTVELTATPRAGVARFTFPSSGGTLVVDATKNDVFQPVGAITTSGKTLDGVTWSGKFCGSQNETQLWFHAEVDQPFSATQVSPGKVRLAFSGSAPVTMSVGISYVSAANATLNDTTEVGSSTFDALHAAATNAWNERLNAIQVTGGNEAEKTKLYTALYHALLHPNVFSDVNGQYVGFDKATHTVPAGHAQYANYSGWDIYRSQVQLVAFLFPDVSSDMLQSLVNDAQTCGYFVMWSQNNADDDVMAGDPGALIVANAYAFGARGFDQKTALQILTHPPASNYTCSNPNVLTPGSPYVAQGYLTPSYYGGAASSTLELANRDYAVAQFAQAQGDAAHAKVYLGRAGAWKYLYTPYVGPGGGAGPVSLQARDANGNFVTPMMAPADETSTIEGSSEQYLWFVPFAIPDLVNVLGGQAAFTARLDTFLTKLNAGQSSPYLYMGNEPSFEIPWEYNWAGAPSHTQAAIHQIVETVFDTTPGTGIPGNDDLGAMSSWLVWAMLGIYPELPGVGGWTLTAPTPGSSG
jgi:predicted alpha-1,2-mannosidase